MSDVNTFNQQEADAINDFLSWADENDKFVTIRRTRWSGGEHELNLYADEAGSYNFNVRTWSRAFTELQTHGHWEAQENHISKLQEKRQKLADKLAEIETEIQTATESIVEAELPSGKGGK